MLVSSQANVGPSSAMLVPYWAHVGPSKGYFVVCVALLGKSWDHCVLILDHFRLCWGILSYVDTILGSC